MIYTHNCSPHNTSVWNCRYITPRNKSVFNSNWLENNIWAASHLLNENGTLMSHREFCSKHKMSVPSKEFKKVVKAILSNIVAIASESSQATQRTVNEYIQLPKL